MESNTSQAPNIQKVQPEVKDVSQAPQQPSAGPQTPIEKIKNFIKGPRIFAPILAYLILLGPTLYLYSGSPPETEAQVTKGAWCVFISPNLLAGLKDIGVNTVQIGGAADPFEFPAVKELVVANIQTAHRNGLKVFLTLSPSVSMSPTKKKKSLEALNLRIIEYAKIAEEYQVEFFAPLNEPEFTNYYPLEENIDPEKWVQEILPQIKEAYPEFTGGYPLVEDIDPEDWVQDILPRIREVNLALAEKFPLVEDIDPEEWTQEILPRIKEVYPEFVEKYLPEEDEKDIDPEEWAQDILPQIETAYPDFTDKYSRYPFVKNIDPEEWIQDILPRIKEVYHGEIIWRAAGLYWSTDYSGYDYIGSTTSPKGMAFEDYPQFIDRMLDEALEIAERDDLKGVMITEFFAWEQEPGHSEEEIVRAFEIAFERGESKAVGFFPTFLEFTMSRKVMEMMERWYKEIL